MNKHGKWGTITFSVVTQLPCLSDLKGVNVFKYSSSWQDEEGQIFSDTFNPLLIVMHAHLEFDYGHSTTNKCQVSSDLVRKQDGISNVYAKLSLPSYTNKHRAGFILIECTIDDNIGPETVKVPSRLFISGGSSSSNTIPGPTIDTCQFVQVPSDRVPVLKEVHILLHSPLYDKLLAQLPSESERLSFLSIKYAIEDLKTVLHENEILARGWIKVLKCSPTVQGIPNFKTTKFVLVRDQEDGSEAPVGSQLRTNSAPRKQLHLQCLPKPVPRDLIKPRRTSVHPGFDDNDDTLFIFAHYTVLLDLDVISGSLVKIKYAGTDPGSSKQHIARLFVLLEPNELQDTNPQYHETIYVHPRLLSYFNRGDPVEIKPISELTGSLVARDVASSVSLAPVGCWHHMQKMYADIIMLSLRAFFLKRRRLLQCGDLIPIAFDSSMAQLCNETSLEAGLMTHATTLVWFRVENVEGCSGTSFFVDPKVTKLVTTNVVAIDTNKIINLVYDKFYDLPSSEVFKYNPGSFPYSQRLLNLVNRVVHNSEHTVTVNPSPILLYSTSSYVGKTTLVRSIAKELNAHMLILDCLTLDATKGAVDSTAKVVGYLTAKLESVMPFLKPPVLIYVSHLDTLFGQNDPGSIATRTSLLLELEVSSLMSSVLRQYPGTCIICSANNIASLPPRLRSSFVSEINIPVPDESQRIDIFNWFLSQGQLNSKVSHLSNSPWFRCNEEEIDLKRLSMLTAGLLPTDIAAVIRIAKHTKIKSLVRASPTTREDAIFPPEVTITESDLLNAISKIRDEYSINIGVPMIPKVSWEDIGGVDQIRGDIMDTIDIPLRYPELFTTGMKKRSGILFYGPPGTGKTLMAKAIASNFQLNFFSVKGPELLNMYIGESEANVRAVFQRAREAKPCVIFFDEIDSLAPKRGGHGDSGGVMDRIVSQLLAELDGVSDGSSGADGVFVFGSTNRPDLLDEALLRPGRFDKLLYLGVPDTREKQLSILRSLTRKFELDETVDLMALAEQCPFHYTGADFYALCSDAMLNAMARVAEEVDRKLLQFNADRQDKGERTVSLSYWFDKVATEEDIQVKVTMNDFNKAQAVLTPSVSKEELEHYLSIKRNFEAS